MTPPRILPFLLFAGLPALLLLASVPLFAAGPAAPASRGTVTPVTAATSGDIRDIKGPIETATNHLPLILASAAGALILAGGALLYLRRRRAGQPSPAPAAHRQALAQLTRAEQLMNSDQADEFADRLADILRTYIEARFHLSAKNRTSSEFVRDLAQDPGIAPLLREHREQLHQWLHLCDMARFARSSLTPKEMRSMLATVREFIRRTSADDDPVSADTTTRFPRSHRRKEIAQ